MKYIIVVILASLLLVSCVRRETQREPATVKELVEMWKEQGYPDSVIAEAEAEVRAIIQQAEDYRDSLRQAEKGE